MSTPPDIVEAVEIALADMNRFRPRILAKLDQAEQEAVFDAFRDLSQYAFTLQDEDGLIALSETIHRMIDSRPELRGTLPLEISDTPKTLDMPDREHTLATKTKELPDEKVSDALITRFDPEEVEKLADQGSQEAEYVDKRATDIGNELLTFATGTQPPAPASLQTTPSGSPADRSSWLSQIWNRFSRKMRNLSS